MHAFVDWSVSSLLVSGSQGDSTPMESCLLCFISVQKRFFGFCHDTVCLIVVGSLCRAYDVFNVSPVFLSESFLDSV